LVSGAEGTADPTDEGAPVGEFMESTFRRLLANTLVTGVTSTFLWFALTFWVFLETDSVIASGVIAGGFSISSAVLAPVFGTFVDRHRKRTAMLAATTLAAAAFAVAATVFFTVDHERLLRLTGPWFWVLVASTLVGSVAGQLRGIALSTTVTLLVPESFRDRANGMVGTVTGVSFALTSVGSGLAVGGLGMGWTYASALVLTVAALLHLATVRFDEPAPERTPGDRVPIMDLRSAIVAVRAVPGLPLLIGLAAFNNLLAGVFMALMDPYGLSLVSVQAWGLLWGVLSLAMIGGGVVVSRRGLGRSPVRLIVGANLAIWTACSLFALRSSILMVALGMVVWLALIPAIEAGEQTVLQASVPFEQQGRVFGFAQLIENAAAPVTALLMAPLAESVFMPFMTDGAGSDLIGGWFGTGPDRGLALMFTIAGLAGVTVTALVRRSRAFGCLEASTAQAPAVTTHATPDCRVAEALVPAA
jgi:DHA3 family multidrug efflux protein-like MFS transporter